jgi:glycosyltransferase involved in cell wall biosynthesis
MKIAQVAPLYESVPPKLYGGTERVVSYLTEELVKKGHEVTLFASADSITQARLSPCVDQALRLAHSVEPLAHHLRMLNRIAEMAASFDIVHFHIDYMHFLLSRTLRLPQVTTLHGRLDIPELAPLYRDFPDMPLASVSNSQRKPLSFANWQSTVYHGLPTDLYRFHPEPGQYLAFLGRISPEKRVDRAIEVALRTGMELRIAAKVDKVDEAYFEAHIKPRLDHPLIHFIGEISEHEKDEFLGNARALLFLIDWPEPFGLAMIEALACGTPVIAYRHGSVPEILSDGETGYIVSDMEHAIAAVREVHLISRYRCRREYEQRFSAARMANDYVEVYNNIIAAREKSLRAA